MYGFVAELILLSTGKKIMQLVNNLNKKKFLSVFGNIFENAYWIAEKVFFQAPFKNFSDLQSKMIIVFESLSYEKQLEIIFNHPDLADKVKIESLSYESKNEQKKSNLDNCTLEEFNEFKNLNISYKKKFGFPFILSVSRKNKNEILNIFRKRILSNKKDEFNEAKIQVINIAISRLNNLKTMFH
mgnify:CR=1 FL=1